jgi:hypothetical protein
MLILGRSKRRGRGAGQLQRQGALAAGVVRHGSERGTAAGREQPRAGLQNPISCTGGNARNERSRPKTASKRRSRSYRGDVRRLSLKFRLTLEPFQTGGFSYEALSRQGHAV